MVLLKDPVTGVQIELLYDDPRYPVLVLNSETFGEVGYELKLSDGSLRRICICHAKGSVDCVCGAWDAYNAELHRQLSQY